MWRPILNSQQRFVALSNVIIKKWASYQSWGKQYVSTSAFLMTSYVILMSSCAFTAWTGVGKSDFLNIGQASYEKNSISQHKCILNIDDTSQINLCSTEALNLTTEKRSWNSGTMIQERVDDTFPFCLSKKLLHVSPCVGGKEGWVLGRREGGVNEVVSATLSFSSSQETGRP